MCRRGARGCLSPRPEQRGKITLLHIAGAWMNVTLEQVYGTQKVYTPVVVQSELRVLHSCIVQLGVILSPRDLPCYTSDLPRHTQCM